MEAHLLDSMLNSYKAQGTKVTLVLQNRSRISGRVQAFDSYIVVMQGERREIVYRHAVSSVFPTPAPAAAGTAEKRPEQARPAARPAKSAAPAADRKKKERPASKPAAAAEPSLNTSMKEGLLRWMQEQKAK